MKGKSGFTLLEMLIVVVIIGILSAALIPRLTGYMARTRDLKRKMDLQNIATAIEAYRNDKGVFPTRGSANWTEHTWGTFQTSPCLPYETFEEALSPYLFPVPKDPVKTNFVQINAFAFDKLPNTWYGDYELGPNRIFCDGRRMPQGAKGIAGNIGQYFYQIFKKGEINMGAAIVVAKVETSEVANYVRFRTWENLQGGILYRNEAKKVGGVWTQKIAHDISDLKLCTSVEKGKQAKWVLQADGSYKCYYTDKNQLYYIVKIE